jgi:hypothetical protein
LQPILSRLPAMRPLIAVLCALSSSLLSGQGLIPSPAPATSSVVDRFLPRTDEPIRTYQARRRLEAHNERLDLEGWMEVRTELVNPTTLLWSIVAEGGSASVRGKVLRKALETEADGLRSGDPARSALTADNYTFRQSEAEPGIAGRRILIDPRRKDRMLLRGSMLVSDPDADLLQVEGRLSRNPSFWTSSVDVVRRYARIAGVRVPVEMVSRARLKIAGLSSFRMTWEYESVNGVPVENEGSAATRTQASSTTRTPR